MRTSLIFSVALSFACNRGPEPKPFTADPAAASESSIPSPPVAPAQAPSPSATQGTGKPTAGGLTWEAPPPFESRPPSGAMRAAEYTLPSRGGEPPLLTVFYFGPGQGGSVDDNLKRWISQFTQPDGRDSDAVAKRATLQVNGMPVTTVDLTGTFAAMAPMQAPSAPKTAQRLLGAIVEGPQGPVFFKLTGEASALETAREAFDALVQSMRPLP